MRIELLDIPSLPDEFQTVHTVKALAVEGKCLALAALLEWKRSSFSDWKKLMKAVRYVGTTERRYIAKPKYVKKCDNPTYGDVYEMRANKGKPRLFFFYDEIDETIVICTNAYEKDDSRRGKSGGQDAAFKLCAQMKAIYERNVA